MSRRIAVLIQGLLPLALALVSTGCGSTATVVPGRSLALLEVRYADGQRPAPIAAGDETLTVRTGRALLRELTKEGFYEVKDARGLRLHSGDLGKDATKTAALRQSVPADAYLSLRLLGCGATPTSETVTRPGSGAGTVTYYWFIGECTGELSALDTDGKSLALLQKSGRWESPRQERADGEAMGAQALNNAVDDLALRIAREIRPVVPAKK